MPGVSRPLLQADAFDLAQEGILTACLYFSECQWNSPDALLGWLQKILRNKVGDAIAPTASYRKRDLARERPLADSEGRQDSTGRVQPFSRPDCIRFPPPPKSGGFLRPPGRRDSPVPRPSSGEGQPAHPATAAPSAARIPGRSGWHRSGRRAGTAATPPSPVPSA